MYAVMEDLYELTKETNPAIYNGLCSLFKNSIPLDANVHNVENVIGLLDQTMPKTMINKSFTELYKDNNKLETSKNQDYSKIVGVFMQLDFVGYGSDKLTDKNPYANLFNDFTVLF
ncbi:MAG: hypothetical protein IPP69_12935 [Flavobacteriales bacterium]|nr:hypothetical protein [Flavobacteriales bacterium]